MANEPHLDIQKYIRYLEQQTQEQKGAQPQPELRRLRVGSLQIIRQPLVDRERV